MSVSGEKFEHVCGGVCCTVISEGRGVVVGAWVKHGEAVCVVACAWCGVLGASGVCIMFRGMWRAG